MKLDIRYAKEKKADKYAYDVFEVIKVDLLRNTMTQIEEFIRREIELGEELKFVEADASKNLYMYLFINESKIVIENGDYILKNINGGSVKILSHSDNEKAFNEVYEFIDEPEGTKITTTKEKILNAVHSNPKLYDSLASLFPEVFEDERTFCKIGSILKREKHPNNVYALFKWNGEVRLLNITQNTFWKTKGDRALKVNKLKDFNQEVITYLEFKRLIGTQSISDFRVIPVESL